MGSLGQSEPAAETTRSGLDLFWRLSQAKSEKQQLEAAARILQAVAKTELEPGYALTRLAQGLATPRSRSGYFICLTDLVRQAELQPGAGLALLAACSPSSQGTEPSKGEQGDGLVAQLLLLTALLRAGVIHSSGDRLETARHLVRLAAARAYLTLPAVRLLVEHCTGEAAGRAVVRSGFNLHLSDLNIHTLYLLLSLAEAEAQPAATLCTKAMLQAAAACLLTAPLPPDVVATHPTLPLLVSFLIKAEKFSKFWLSLSPELTNTNNSGHVGWLVLQELAGREEGPNLLLDVLSRHTLGLGVQLAGRKASGTVVRGVMARLVTGSEAGQLDKQALATKLLTADLCWDAVPGMSGTVLQLLTGADPPVVQAVAAVYRTNLCGELTLRERLHCAAQLARLGALPRMKAELDWRADILHCLASLGLLTAVPNIAPLNSAGRDQMKDVLFRALDTRSKSLRDSLTLQLGLVRHIQEALAAGATRVKPLSEDQEAVLQRAGETIKSLAEVSGRDGAAGAGEVFLLLYCQLWLQMLSQPDLAGDLLTELHPVHERWAAGPGQAGEPHWVEVATEILLSLLAQNNRLLRAVVGSVFSVIGKDMTEPAIAILLDVLKQKNPGDKTDDDDEDDEDMDEATSDVENDESVEKENDDHSNDSSSEEEDEESDEESDDEGLNENMKKVNEALGDHAADSESDLDMDEVPDEEMSNLDQKLVEAFKALGGRKDSLAKKKAAQSKLASLHFKLRVLDLVESYLSHSPNPTFIPAMVAALLESLDTAVRGGRGHSEPLVKRLVATLSRLASTKLKMDEGTDLSEAVGEEVVSTVGGLLELGGAGGGVVTALGPTLARLLASLLRLACQYPNTGPALQQHFSSSLSAWLTQPTCVQQAAVFSVALSQAWPGTWSLAHSLAAAAHNQEVRQYRRVAALSLLAGLLRNKQLAGEHETEMRTLQAEVVPAVTTELLKIEQVDKLKPKLLTEMLTVLCAADTSLIKGEVCEKLQTLAKRWPKAKHYAVSKKPLIKILKRMNLSIEFKIIDKPAEMSQAKPDVSISVAELKPNNKKRKKKSSERKAEKKAKQAEPVPLSATASETS